VSKREKLIERFLSSPKDFTWKELTTVLSTLGYRQINGGITGGSRVRFIRYDYPPIILHKPHPRPVLKQYQLDAIIDLLRNEDIL
jgi:hypothetical protein